MPSTRGDPAQAVGAALAFVADSNPDAAVVDGYATLSRRVQRGEEPTDLVAGHAMPCARRPSAPFTAGERAAVRAAFDGRSVGVDVRWDGRAWQAAAIAGRGG